MSCRVAAFLRERNDGHSFWDGHALLFRVGRKGSTRCLRSIALFPAEAGVSWTVSAPRRERHPPRAGNLRSASCFTNSTPFLGFL